MLNGSDVAKTLAHIDMRIVGNVVHSGAEWCNLHFAQAYSMAVTAKRHLEKEPTRASVTFPADLYAELERIAEEKKVSVAWVVRDAVEKYVEAQ